MHNVPENGQYPGKIWKWTRGEIQSRCTYSICPDITINPEDVSKADAAQVSVAIFLAWRGMAWRAALICQRVVAECERHGIDCWRPGFSLSFSRRIQNLLSTNLTLKKTHSTNASRMENPLILRFHIIHLVDVVVDWFRASVARALPTYCVLRETAKCPFART